MGSRRQGRSSLASARGTRLSAHTERSRDGGGWGGGNRHNEAETGSCVRSKFSAAVRFNRQGAKTHTSTFVTSETTAGQTFSSARVTNSDVCTFATCFPTVKIPARRNLDIHADERKRLQLHFTSLSPTHKKLEPEASPLPTYRRHNATFACIHTHTYLYVRRVGILRIRHLHRRHLDRVRDRRATHPSTILRPAQ